MAEWRKRIVNWIGIVLIVAVVVLAMAWLAGAFRRNKIAPGEVQVVHPKYTGPTTRLSLTEQLRQVDVAGSIQAENRSSISSRLVANILEMSVRAGDRVKRGQTLVLLDDAAPRARVEQAREALRSAEASRDLAQVETERVTRAAEAHAASASDRDTWMTRLAAAKADVARSEQALKEAQVGLNDARLTSPIDGVVIDRLSEPGDQASPGKPLLTIYDPSKMRVEASVPEAYVGRISVGQKLQVHIDTLNQTREATVSQIVPVADPSSRSFLVKALLEDPGQLYPGMFARLRIPLDPAKVLEVPQTAIQTVGQLAFVSVIKDGVAERRCVRLGQRHGDNVEILSGLEPGDVIAASLSSDTRSGSDR